ncbi:MAG TPA: TrkA family potassium uptake protein [Phycisphaerae bacterium]|nr:TrkA family potassium uptake protein [Phycisphaerae bacterium]HRY69117.1 TrkA family potassium uptake protein [Phycisphaerae bacterium]HSA29463.1 TrkA family potassium uptake protein [Phycisphaerae bacterium]
MRNFIIVGLGSLGQCLLRSLAARNLQVIVIDRSDDKIQQVRDLATQAIMADALNRQLFEEVLPEGMECAIVDLGDQMQASILVTNYLAKLKVPEIVVEAVNAEHAEILKIVGATRVIFPEEEAAERLAGILAGRGILDFFAVDDEFSMVEIPVPEAWVNKTVVQLELTRKARLVLVAIRRGSLQAAGQWRFPDPDAPLEPNDVLLLAGAASDVQQLQR